jgi:hypothetical protein
METDIGNPIEYDPINDPFKNDEKNEDSTPIQHEQPYYFQPSEMMYPQQQFYPHPRKDRYLLQWHRKDYVDCGICRILIRLFHGENHATSDPQVRLSIQ